VNAHPQLPPSGQSDPMPRRFEVPQQAQARISGGRLFFRSSHVLGMLVSAVTMQ
jgi:hypothetical protein